MNERRKKEKVSDREDTSDDDETSSEFITCGCYATNFVVFSLM